MNPCSEMDVKVDDFVEWMKNKNLKPRTLENYSYYFGKFNVHDQLNQESVARFLAQDSNRNSVARSFLLNLRKYLINNRAALKISEGYFNQIVEIELPKLSGRKKVRLVNPISHENIFVLEKYLEDERLKLMLVLTYFCALRLGELLKITINSFNWDEWKKKPEGMGEVRVFGKGDKEGIALIPSGVMKRVARFIPTQNYKGVGSRLFMSDGENLSIKSQGSSWQKKLRQAGLDSGLTQLGPEGAPLKASVVHPHRLRHSFASHLLLDKKKDIRIVQEALRHASIQSTQIYTYIDKDRLKKELE